MYEYIYVCAHQARVSIFQPVNVSLGNPCSIFNVPVPADAFSVALSLEQVCGLLPDRCENILAKTYVPGTRYKTLTKMLFDFSDQDAPVMLYLSSEGRCEPEIISMIIVLCTFHCSFHRSMQNFETQTAQV